MNFETRDAGPVPGGASAFVFVPPEHLAAAATGRIGIAGRTPAHVWAEEVPERVDVGGLERGARTVTATPAAVRGLPGGVVSSLMRLQQTSTLTAVPAFDPQEMVTRFRERAEAVRTRGMPPIEGAERQRFREQAQRDFADFAMIGDAEAELVDGILTLRIDLRPGSSEG